MTTTTRQKRDPEAQTDGPLKPENPIPALSVESWLPSDLKKQVEEFNKKRKTALILRAAALDTIDDTLDAITAGTFSKKDITAADAARNDLLIADSIELHLCTERIRLADQYEPANRACRQAIQDAIDEREKEIQTAGEKAEEPPLVIHAKIQTDKKIAELCDSAPTLVDPHGRAAFYVVCNARRELLEAGLVKRFTV